MTIPILDLALVEDPNQRQGLLDELRDALFDVGFLYIRNHGVPEQIISGLVQRVPALFRLSDLSKSRLSKTNSPHFLGYSGLAEETTLGKQDLREQFDFATELPVIFREKDVGQDSSGSGRDFSKPYWRLRGPNLWPGEDEMPGFKEALLNYHDALSELSHRFVHLIEEVFGIPIGTFDVFFGSPSSQSQFPSGLSSSSSAAPRKGSHESFLCPQNRIKIAKYHHVVGGSGTSNQDDQAQGQGVGPHKDSSGWLTFLYQIRSEKGLEVLSKHGNWIPADPIPGTLVVNFGNAFEAATEGAVRATVHRVQIHAPALAQTQAPGQKEQEQARYSIPFFMGLPYDLKISEIQSFIPQSVRSMRRSDHDHDHHHLDAPASASAPALPPAATSVSPFLDARWDTLGDSVLRKWVKSHPDVARRWYAADTVEYYTR